MFPPNKCIYPPFSVQLYKKKKLQVEGPFYKDAFAPHLNHLGGVVITPRPSVCALIYYVPDVSF